MLKLEERVQKFLSTPLEKQKKSQALRIYNEVIGALDNGLIRVAEKKDDAWHTNLWIKEVIMLGFKYGTLKKKNGGIANQPFFDKSTIHQKKITSARAIRLVPGGSSIRFGSYVAPGTIVMPPAFINIGSYIDSGCLIDSHALVGSCAQIGKNVHLSAAAQIGGVLEPVGALPVIIEDNVFIGGNSGIYAGTIVSENAVIGSGVILTASTPLFDNVSGQFIIGGNGKPLIVPKNAVVVAGARPISKGQGAQLGMNVYCPIIIKYRDDKTSASVALENLLR